MKNSIKFYLIKLIKSLRVIIWFSVRSERIPGRRAETDKDFKERDGCLSLYREQRCATGGQQTYFYQRSLWVMVITPVDNLLIAFYTKWKEILYDYKSYLGFCFTVSPVIHVPNQLVGAPLSTDVVLECFVEASPKSINYWVKDNGKILFSNNFWFFVKYCKRLRLFYDGE